MADVQLTKFTLINLYLFKKIYRLISETAETAAIVLYIYDIVNILRMVIE